MKQESHDDQSAPPKAVTTSVPFICHRRATFARGV